MALLRKKCVRCGQRTREKHEGLPTCDACMAEIQLDREQQRRCPIDGTEMDKQITYNVVIDKCPECKGVWLDRGELSLIEEEIRSDQGNEFGSGFLAGLLIG